MPRGRIMKRHGSGAYLVGGRRARASWWREALAVGAILCAVVLISWLILGRIEARARSDAVRSLSALLDTTREAYQFWFVERKNQLDALTADPYLIGLIKLQLLVDRNREALAASPAQAQMREYLRPYLERHGDLGFFVVAPDRVNVGSLRDVNLGKTNLIAEQRPLVLDSAFGGMTVLIPPVASDVPLQTARGAVPREWPTMFVASPVRDSQGDVMAVFCLRIDPLLDFSEIASMGRLGETGESYAFDEAGRLLTESRFEAELQSAGSLAPGQTSVLAVRVADPGGNLLAGHVSPRSVDELPLTRMAASATEGEAGQSTGGYRDYRGLHVLGAWLWDDALRIGLVTEIDEKEALRTYRVIRGLVVLGSGATTAIALFLVFSLARIYRRSEAEIRLREQRLDMILRTAGDGIVTIDDKGTMLSVNPATERLFGYRREHLIGTNVSLLMPEPYRSEHRGYVDQYLTTGVARVIGIGRETEGRRQDGSTFPAHLSVSKMMLEGRDILHRDHPGHIGCEGSAEGAAAGQRRGGSSKQGEERFSLVHEP